MNKFGEGGCLRNALNLIVMFFMIAFLFFLLGWKQNANSDLSLRILQGQGYTDIQTSAGVSGYCGQQEMPTLFTAKKDGVLVNGVVCVDNLRQTGYVRFR